MKSILVLLLFFVLCLPRVSADDKKSPAVPASSPEWPMIIRKADMLYENEKPFRFLGLCASNLNLTKQQILPDWSNRWPNEFEIRDTLDGLNRVGARATRVGIGLSVYSAKDRTLNVHIPARRTYNEEAFQALDRVLAYAREYDIRIIFPFIASQSFTNTRGAEEFAALSGRTNFWSDPEVKADFKHLVSFILNRRNTVNGIVYKDDATILAWQLGNEFGSYAGDRGLSWNEFSPQILAWTKEMAAYCKQEDPKHLVMEAGGCDREPLIEDPSIDLISSHLYEYWSKVKNEPYELAPMARHERKDLVGKKPLIVDELGLAAHDNLKSLFVAIREENIVGGLLWGIRGHRRDGGWYYHNEGGTNVNSYHVPGFATGFAYEEIRTLDLLRQEAYLIRGETPPPLRKPTGVPVLLRLDAGFIWVGCAGANFYTIERAETAAGPWTLSVPGLHDSIIADVKTLEAKNLSAPTVLWYDETALPGQTYHYRIKATNAAGDTPWSEVLAVKR